MQTIGFDTTPVLIGGHWRACANGQTLPLFNPSDGSALARIARGGAAPAMGNACVLKPAEEACLTALAFARFAQHPGVRHISFSGSAAIGQAIQAAAAKNVVPVTLELGGKSPQIVFDDADLDAALPSLVNAGIQNAGQTCSAASRVLVRRGVYDAVATRMAARYAALRVGPAMDDLDVGPLISSRQRDAVRSVLDRAASDPALRLLARAPLPDEAAAVRIANGTAYGLVAGVWTRDGARKMRMARALHCGQVFINNYGAGGGVELPFGGVKHSGHGREKGFEALYGFSAVKTVAIQHG